MITDTTLKASSAMTFSNVRNRIKTQFSFAMSHNFFAAFRYIRFLIFLH